MCDLEELAEYDSTTPTTLDYLASYRDGVEPLKYQISRTTAATALNANGLIASGIAAGVARAALLVPGDVPADAVDTNPFGGTATQKFRSFPTNVLSHDLNRPVVGGKYRTSRGSFIIDRISNQPPNGAGATVPGVTDTIVYVTVTLTEPLLLSPFVFGSPENKQGFYGITNMNFQMNMTSDANRAWRSVRFPKSDGVLNGGNLPPYAFTKTATVHSVASSALTFTFLTGHATDRLPSRNIVPIPRAAYL